MPIKYKLIISILIIGLSVAAVLYAWSPLLVTYVPIAQAYNFPPEQAEVVEGILASRIQLQTNALEVSSLLILAVLIVALAVIWVPKRNASINT